MANSTIDVNKNNPGVSDKKSGINSVENIEERRKFAFKAGVFLTGVTIASAVAGFSTTVAAVRKREHEVLAAAGFPEGKITEILAHEAGARLALRALGWGTVWAVSGVSLISLAAWKLSGAHNFQEFRLKMGGILPRIPRKEPQGPSEFSTFQDFVDYISEPSKPKDSKQ